MSGTYGAKEAAQKASVPYGRLDQWIRAGVVHPDPVSTDHWVSGDPDKPGRGFLRYFSETEVKVIALIAELRAVGLDIQTAEKVARNVVKGPGTSTHLGRGIYVTVTGRRDV